MGNNLIMWVGSLCAAAPSSGELESVWEEARRRRVGESGSQMTVFRDHDVRPLTRLGSWSWAVRVPGALLYGGVGSFLPGVGESPGGGTLASACTAAPQRARPRDVNAASCEGLSWPLR